MAHVTVVNKKRGEAGEYVGRGSALGNPFRIGPGGDRDAVIAQYRQWFDDCVNAGDEAVLAELRRIYRVARDNGSVRLQCYCAPAACHADVIREFLENHLGAKDETTTAPTPREESATQRRE